MLAKDFLKSLDDKNQLKKYKDIRFIVQKDSDAGTLSGDIKAFYDYKNIKLALKKPQDDYDEYFLNQEVLHHTEEVVEKETWRTIDSQSGLYTETVKKLKSKRPTLDIYIVKFQGPKE